VRKGSPVVVNGLVVGHVVSGDVPIQMAVPASRVSPLVDAQTAPLSERDDYAIVIDSTDPSSNISLPDSADGAQVVASWLSEQGVPAAHITRLRSPTRAQIADAFVKLALLISRRRRLTIYFSGVGARQQQRLLVFPTGAGSPPVGIDWRQWVEALAGFHGFPEVLSIVNALLMLPPPTFTEARPDWATRSARGIPQRMFTLQVGQEIALEALKEGRYEPGRPLQWNFEQTLIEGLRGAAAEDDGAVTTDSLAGFLESRDEMNAVEYDTVGGSFELISSERMAALRAQAYSAAPDAPPNAPDTTQTTRSRAEGSENSADRAIRERAEALKRSLESAHDADVMTEVRNRESSVAQSTLEEEDAHPGTETRAWWRRFGDKFSSTDLGWAKSIFSALDRANRHPILRPESVVLETLPDTLQIGIVGNFGTGAYAAPVIAESLRKSVRPFDVLIHLGGIFYSGTEREVDERFLKFWPSSAARINRALNGNHEMYSGGSGYFTRVLPTFKQAASYFALANSHWILVGLDTAYVDQTVDDQQFDWFTTVMREARGRRVIVFSHHPLYPPVGESKPTKLAERFAPVLQEGAIASWISGWESYCAVYDADPRWRAAVRLAGNGGLPDKLPEVVKAAPIERRVGRCDWRRLPRTEMSPPCLYLDGPNPYVSGREDEFCPQGYLTFELDGPRANEEVHLANGEVVMRSRLDGPIAAV
jgi:hypothetical protein